MSSLPKNVHDELCLMSPPRSEPVIVRTVQDSYPHGENRPVPSFWNFAEDDPGRDHFTRGSKLKPMRHHA